MNEFNQVFASTIIAVLITSGSVGAWIYILIKLAKHSKRKEDKYRIGFAAFGLAVTIWYAIGYYIILFGAGLDTAYYFRPATSFLMILAVMSGLGMLERNDDKEIIEKLKNQNKELMQDLEKCMGMSQNNGVD